MPDGYHIYKDELDFAHSAVLVRQMAIARFKEKHTLNVSFGIQLFFFACLALVA